MSLLIVLPALAVAIHILLAIIFWRSRPGRRLLIALLLIAVSYPVQMFGVVAGLSGETLVAGLVRLCLFAPALFSVLSFLVYVPALTRKPEATPPAAGASPRVEAE